MARNPEPAPPSLRHLPFRGGPAVARGLLTRGQLTGPRWRRLLRDVYLHADATVDHLTWCEALALLLPAGAAISHRTAAYLYGVDLLSRPPLRRGEADRPALHATVPLSCRCALTRDVTVHRARLLPADIRRRNGLWVTSPLRTAFDLGRDGDVIALDALLTRRVVRPHDLVAIGRDRAGWPGIARFRSAASLARYGAASPMETVLRLIVVRGGLPEPTVQHEVFDRNGHFVGRLDLAYEEVRVGLEYDGDHHRERATFQADAVRANRLRLCGWAVLRFTADDVLRHPDRVVAQVRAALGGRLRMPTARNSMRNLPPTAR